MKYTIILAYCVIAVILFFASCKKDDTSGNCPTRLAKETDEKGDMTAKYVYSDDGLLSKVLHVNGPTDEYYYQSGKLEHVNFGVNGTRITYAEYYTYDDSNRLSFLRQENDYGGGQRTITYRYYGNSRSCVYGNPNSDTTAFVIEDLDNEGNVLVRKTYDVFDSLKLAGTTTYTYDDKMYLMAFLNPKTVGPTHNVLTETVDNGVFHNSVITAYSYNYYLDNYPVKMVKFMPSNLQADSTGITTRYVYGCE